MQSPLEQKAITHFTSSASVRHAQTLLHCLPRHALRSWQGFQGVDATCASIRLFLS